MTTPIEQALRYFHAATVEGDKERDYVLAIRAELESQDAEIARLREALEEARKDAERYRWLRENCMPWRSTDAAKVYATVTMYLGLDSSGNCINVMKPGPETRVGIPSLDFAIDAAIAAGSAK